MKKNTVSIEMKTLYMNIKGIVQNTIGSCHILFRVIILMMECISALALSIKNKNGARRLLDGNRVLGLNMQLNQAFSALPIKGYSNMSLANGIWILLQCTGDQSLYLITMAQETKPN